MKPPKLVQLAPLHTPSLADTEVFLWTVPFRFYQQLKYNINISNIDSISVLASINIAHFIQSSTISIAVAHYIQQKSGIYLQQKWDVYCSNIVSKLVTVPSSSSVLAVRMSCSCEILKFLNNSDFYLTFNDKDIIHLLEAAAFVLPEKHQLVKQESDSTFGQPLASSLEPARTLLGFTTPLL